MVLTIHAAYKRRCTEESEAFGGNLAEGDPKGAQAGARAKSVKAQCLAMSKMPSAASVRAAAEHSIFR